MKTETAIALEVRSFLETSGYSAQQLADAAKVFPATISQLKTGARADVRSVTADALRAGMERLRQSSCSEIPNDCPKETPHAPEQERAQSPAVSRAAALAVPA